MAFRLKTRAVLHRIAFASGLSSRLAKRNRRGSILMYHGIPPDRAEVFAAELSYIKREFRVVPLAALLEDLAGDHPEKVRRVALTFDDGLKNNFTVVYPILRALGLPATFFVCPGLIDTATWIWNDEARQRLKSLQGSERAFGLRAIGSPVGDVEETVTWMKTLRISERREVEKLIRSATPTFQPSQAEHDHYDLMTWSEIKRLDATLIEIGSHTWDHAILPTLGTDDCVFQLATSKNVLEEKLDRPIGLFCYPNGATTPAVIELARTVYSAAVSTEPAALQEGDDRFRLPRIPAGENPELTAWRMYRPNA